MKLFSDFPVLFWPFGPPAAGRRTPPADTGDPDP